jgi:hypothetical protein
MLLPIIFSLMLGFTFTASADKGMDQNLTRLMRRLQPATAKAGEFVLVKGEIPARDSYLRCMYPTARGTARFGSPNKPTFPLNSWCH